MNNEGKENQTSHDTRDHLAANQLEEICARVIASVNDDEKDLRNLQKWVEDFTHVAFKEKMDRYNHL